MKITIALLYDLRACSSGVMNVTDWGLIGLEHDAFIRECVERNRFDYAVWLTVRLLKTSERRTKFAIFAARQVLPIFEGLCPGDNRPRRAIVEAEDWFMDRLHMTEENAKAVVAAASLNAADIPDIPDRTAALAAAVSARNAARTAIASGVDSVPETDMAVVNAINAADYVGCIDVKRAIIEFGIELINQGERNEPE